MIRVLHFADLHLGVENYGRIDPETGLSTRALDFLRVFDDLIEFATRDDGQGPVDLVLFAGDAFKTRDPSPTYQREFARRLYRLAVTEQIPVFLLVGNHDVPNASNQAHSLEIFSTLAIPGVTVARRPERFVIGTRHGPLQLVALPWVTRSMLLARDEYKGSGLEEINQLMLERLDRVVDSLAGACDATMPTILTAHGTVQGAVFGAERNVMLGYDLVLPRSLLTHAAFNYVALGHIHKHQCVLEDPPAVYSGSLERIDFGEADEDKGFVLVELDGPAVPARWRFQPSAARAFVSVTVDVEEGDPTAAVLAALQRRQLDGAVVRVLVRMPPELEPLLDDNQIFKALAPAFHVAAVSRDIKRTARLRLSAAGGNVEALAPREILARYFEYRQVPVPRVERLLAYADTLMAGDDSERGDP